MNKVIIYQCKFLGNKKQVDFKKKELYFTEKFALLNLLNALGKLSSPDKDKEAAANVNAARPPEEPPAPQQTQNNMFAHVLERHEAISNRIKNRK